MRKITRFLLSIFALLLFSSSVYASEPVITNSIEFFDNGDYLITTVEDKTSSSNFILCSTTTTKSKISKYYNSNNEVMWYVKVTGTFTYGNGTSKCTASSVEAQSYVSPWKITSKSASKSGNTAIGKATAKQYFDGNVVNTINRTLKLTCSPTGEFS